MTGGCDHIATEPAALLRKPVTTRPAKYRRHFWSDDFSAACGDPAFLDGARSLKQEDA